MINDDCFSSAFTPETEKTLPMMNDEPKPDIDLIHVENNGVVEMLRTLDVHKASRPDGIPAH